MVEVTRFSLPTCSYLGTVNWDSRPLLFFYHMQSFFLCCMSLCIYCGVVREFQWVHGNLYMYLNLHLSPSYAWNNKHCYGGNNTNGCWQTDGHINGHNTGMREQFPAPTYREAEWSVLHSGTGEALLTLECAAVFMLNLSWCGGWMVVSSCPPLSAPASTSIITVIVFSECNKI